MAGNDDLKGLKPSDTLTLEFRRQTERREFRLPTLRVVAGPDMLRFCSVYPTESIVIGREDDCDLVLHDPSVSRRHALVRSETDHALTLEDLGSTNGTARNGVPVHGPVPLAVGDQVEIGGVTLRVDKLGLEELSHLARVVERLNLANKDALTGLTIRRYLEEELPGVVSRHEAAGAPISAVFLDIDRFKVVNDRHGHAVGDEVLRAVARLLALTARDTDTCVRYGGEELLALLPDCGEDGAARMAERLRLAIRAHEWGHYVPGLSVTVSLGVAERLPGEGTAAWLARADKALYAAKHAGRDQVVRASTLPGVLHSAP